MEKITINTGRSDFLLIDRILHSDHQSIIGVKTFSNDPDYLGIESLAQLCAMHVRHRVDFRKHAFLLKINHYENKPKRLLNGKYDLRATRIAGSEHAYSYRSEIVRNKVTECEGEFLIATKAYDETFKEETLMSHYKKVFSCLRSGTETDF